MAAKRSRPLVRAALRGTLLGVVLGAATTGLLVLGPGTQAPVDAEKLALTASDPTAPAALAPVESGPSVARLH